MRNPLYHAARAAGRTAVREQNRVRLANERAIKKQQKEDYLNSRLNETENLNKHIYNNISNFVNACNSICRYNRTFDFNNYKKEYEASTFSFRSKPIFINNADKIIIPKESWLENIFKSKKEKRIECERKKSKQIEVDKINYENALMKYNDDLAKAKDEYAIAEDKRKMEIEDYNNNIELWEKNYYLGERKAVIRYLSTLISEFNLRIEFPFIKSYDIDYSSKERKLFIELILNSHNNLFVNSGYKYVRTRDVIEPIIMNKKDIKKYLTMMYSDIPLGFLKLFFENDDAKIIDVIEINVRSDNQNKYTISISKKDFEKYDVINEKEQLIEKYMKAI